MKKRFIFVSYARNDAERVRPIVEALGQEYRMRALDVEVWADYTHLRPGEIWSEQIEQALEDSLGMLIFVSPESIKNEWVLKELTIALTAPNRFIIPVILRFTPNIPPQLKAIQWLDLSKKGSTTKANIQKAVRLIADATEAKLSPAAAPTTPPVTAAAAPAVAATLAEEARGAHKAPEGKPGPPDSVFVVHGHDQTALSEMEAYLTARGVKSVILSKLGGATQSLLQKFLQTAADARFAIVILSADDLGASRTQYDAEDGGKHALQFRARQNVILELGFFYGLLGWENVFVLSKPPDKVFPNFERPSDIAGAVFESMDAAGNWRASLAGKLTQAGFRLKEPAAAKKGAKAKKSVKSKKGVKSSRRRGAGAGKGVAAERRLLALLLDSRYPDGRYLKTLCEKTGLSAGRCRTLLRKMGARKVELNNGEGWAVPGFRR